MILRYTGNVDDDETPRVSPSCPLRVGHAYEVAEIYEWPWHLMAREPRATCWPAPGSPWFGLNADEFETTDEPIPILRSGFVRYERLAGFFGVILESPDHAQRLTRPAYLRHPHAGESFDAWRVMPLTARYAHQPGLANADLFEPEFVRACFDWFRFPADEFFGPPEVGYIYEALAPSEPLQAPFAFLGRLTGTCCCRECFDARAAALKKCTERVLETVGIRGVAARLLDVSFWQSTESERPPPDVPEDEEPEDETSEF